MSSLNVHPVRPSISFHRYWDSIFIVSKNVIYRVFLWLYEGGTVYVGDYLRTKPRKMKQLGTMAKEALRNKECPSSFDICLLYALLQRTCGLAEETENTWKNPVTPEEQSSLEHSLFQLKNKRNLLSHKPQTLIHMTQSDLDCHLQSLRQLCSHIFRKAGQKVNNPISDVESCVVEMERDLNDIKTKPMPSGFTAKKFALIAKQEMIRKHSPSKSSKTFVLPMIHSTGNNGRYERSLNNFASWRCENGSLPVATVLQGDSGYGKTSICGYIFDSWVTSNEDLINDLQDFDLVVPVQCCDVSTRDIIEVLKNFMEETISLCDRTEIISYLRELRILWLIDGLEEATKDANELLKNRILGLGTTSCQLMLITTHQDRCQDVMSNLLTYKDRLCEVTLSGLTGEGVKSFVGKYMQEIEKDPNVCQVKTEKFLIDMLSYNNDITKELKIPLKLKLIIELWQEGKLQKDSSASLKHLYDAIIEAHKQKLKHKIHTKFDIKLGDIQNRINSWINVLCQIAFEMLMQKKFININITNQKKLEKAAEGLIVPEYCLSIFLVQNQYINSCSSKSYAFFHGSQQLYFSARHLASNYMTSSSNVCLGSLFQQILSVNPEERYQYSQVLLFVVSFISVEQYLQQSTIEALIPLLYMCPNVNAFEIVQYAGYCPLFVKEISKSVSDIWEVSDHTLKAAMALMQFKTPLIITINILTNPKDLEDLPEFLKIVSCKKLFISLNIWHHIYSENHSSEFSSHCYLTPISSSEANCKLVSFTGNLTLNDIQVLPHMKHVMILYLTVYSNSVLDGILHNLKPLVKLEALTLFIKMPVITTPKPSIKLKENKITISLPNMEDSTVVKTAKALAQISKHYNNILVFDTISANAATKFIKVLEKKAVKANNVKKLVSCLRYNDEYTVKFDSLPSNQQSYNGEYTVNFGPLPLNHPLDYFSNHWARTQVSITENDLGMNQIELNHPGISTSDVEYHTTTVLPDIKTYKV